MTTTMLPALAGLALVDSTSFGTLGIPVFMLLQRRVSIRALLGYLATIAVFYWVLGVVLVLGASTLTQTFDGLGGSRTVIQAQLVLGVALFAVSWLFDGKQAARRRARRAASGAGPTRRERWKDALVGERPRVGVIVAVALAAGLVEAASMLPYLGAVGMMTQANLGPLAVGAVLTGYVVVMVMPALLLLGLRLGAAGTVEPLLARLGGWLERNSDEMLGWILGIVGFLLAADAAQRLQVWPFAG